MSRVVSEALFARRLVRAVKPFRGVFRCVTGPGRSGAVAAVYASHRLGIPFIPEGVKPPDTLRPVMVIDTASKTGRTLRRAVRRVGANGTLGLAVFTEPPRIRFWYEAQYDLATRAAGATRAKANKEV